MNYRTLKDCILCERLKCRGTLLWPAFLLIPVIPAALGSGNYLANLELLHSEWYSLWTQISLFYSNFFFAPLIGIYCAFLWRYENAGTCRCALFAQPVSSACIYLGKYLWILAVTALTQLWLCLLYLIAGKLCSLPGLPPAQIFFWIARGLMGGFVLAAIQFILAFLFKSFSTPVCFGLLGGISGLAAANSRFGILWPYSLMLLGMNANKSEDMLASPALFLAVCLFYLAALNFLGILLLKRVK